MNHKYEYTKGSFEPTFESLYKFKCPEWFRDAKFGLWSHWGAQSVPMYGDWYARNMYIEDSQQYLYHLRHYGHPSKFGYKDLVQLWKAEKFDPEELMALYKKAGARYFMAQAMHHDNFFNYDSRVNRFNSVQMGPHKDIVALWKAAAKREDLHFGITEHHGAAFEFLNTNKLCDTKGPYAGVPYDGNDPEYVDLYLDNKHTIKAGSRRHYTWDERWYPRWYEAIKEVVDQYEPEILYSDGALPFWRNYAETSDPTWNSGLHMTAHLYNSSEARNGGKNQAVYMHKDSREEYYRVGIQDIERGLVTKIRKYPWQTDTCLGSWFYDVRAIYKGPRLVCDLLVDIVSKNGNLLLNVPQLPDGTIDEQCRWTLEKIGEWIAVCGEGIYETRPYHVYGEGPTVTKAESETEWTKYDVRYTRKGETVYAFLMKGEGGPLSLHEVVNASAVRKVSLLGYGESGFFAEPEKGVLTITLPLQLPCEYANCVKIEY